MKIELERFRDGRLKIIVHHEDSSYFWIPSLTECPKLDNEKLKLEVLMMVDWWNNHYHKEFDLFWKTMFKDRFGNEYEN